MNAIKNTAVKTSITFKLGDVMSIKDLAYADARVSEASGDITLRAIQMIPEIGNVKAWSKPLDALTSEDLSNRDIMEVPKEIIEQLKSGYLLRYLELNNTKHVLPFGKGKEKMIETKTIMAFSALQITAMGKTEDKAYLDSIKQVRKTVQTVISNSYKRLVDRCYKQRHIDLVKTIALETNQTVEELKEKGIVGGRGATLLMVQRIPKVLDDLYIKAKQENTANKNIDLEAMQKIITKAKIDLAKCVKLFA